MDNNEVSQSIGNKLLTAVNIAEQQIDAEIDKLDRLDDLEALKQKRLSELKKQQKQKQVWLINGHGEYNEIVGEKEFFTTTKNSDCVVIHFFLNETFLCKIFDKHLSILAGKYIGTKFCKIDANKSPFLCDRLKIRVMPTLVAVKDGKTVDFVVGFSDLGNHDEFSTEMLAWRLGQSQVINYAGDLLKPPLEASTKKGSGVRKNRRMNIITKNQAQRSIKDDDSSTGDDDE